MKITNNVDLVPLNHLVRVCEHFGYELFFETPKENNFKIHIYGSPTEYLTNTIGSENDLNKAVIELLQLIKEGK